MSILDRLFGQRRAVIIDSSGGSSYVLDLDTENIYRTQANLQAVVSFLADSVADLPLKVYKRESDTDRPRVTNSATALLLKRPNDQMTTFEFFRAVVSDLCLFGQSVVLIVDDRTSPSGYQLLNVPHSWISVTEGNGWSPQYFVITAGRGGSAVRVPASEVLYFHNYNPASPWKPASPIDALRQTLQEQIEAGRFRTQVWRRGGRVNTYITRPKEVQGWSPEVAKKWRDEFKAVWTGDHGSEAGGVPVLEDGMEIKTLQFNSREAQWFEAAQLSRSEVAAAYHINPALIWHDTSQTYASAKDNARALYADTLGPWLTMLQQRMNGFLLPRIGADPDEYVEFDIQKKLQGSFEERASVIQTSVGAPWITRNEARAMNNLPRIEGGDELVVPLNVLEGGQASPTDSAPKSAPVYTCETCDGCETKAGTCDEWHRVVEEIDDEGVSDYLTAKSDSVQVKSDADEDTEKEFQAVYERFFERQAKTVLSKVKTKDGADWFDMERWCRELADDLLPLTEDTTAKKAREVCRALGIDPDTYSVPLTAAYLRKMCEARAQDVNTNVYDQLQASIDAGIEPREVYEKSVPATAEKSGRALAAAALTFACYEAIGQAQKNGLRARRVTKTWRVNSTNPRSSHKAMDGETVAYSAKFSNGARFPQDATLSAEEACNCLCSVEINVER